MHEPTHIEVVGAREHNLDGVDVKVPRDALVVFTGVSGSGKSSLAFDTIYKEGQRRYMESLSAYARQFLGQMTRPDVESVSGLSPTLCIDQKTVNRNPRSTVGTVTEIYDHLRLLMARLGTPHCPACGTEITHASVGQVVDAVLERALDHKIQVLGPVVQDRKGEYRKELADLHREGWLRARVDGTVRRLDEEIELARYEKHTIEVVVDRLKVSHAERSRLAEALETGARLGGGVVRVLVGEEDELVYSTDRACPHHPELSIPELEPRLFSFNAPQGMCEGCGGLGKNAAFDVDRLIRDDLPPVEGFQAFNDDGRVPFGHLDRPLLATLCKQLGVSARKKLRDWPEAARHRLIHGDPELRYTTLIERGTQTEKRERSWAGLLPMVEHVWHFTRHQPFERFRVERPCASCGGARLNPIARAVTFRGRDITELSHLSVGAAHAFFSSVELTDKEAVIGALLLRELQDRLAFLHEVGLSYLSLDRSAATLSGGEGQRIRLASQVGSALQGVTYVLDEPSIGLHPRDNARLISALHRLRDRGNSVLVVEHDLETIEASDWVVDVGPGAGRLGGQITASGTPGRFRRSRSLTAEYMRGERSIAVPEQRREPSGWLGVRGAAVNNLTDVDVDVPLGVLVVVTGVSGSGKSSLVFEALEEALTAIAAGDRPSRVTALEGAERVDKVIEISQTPIGRTPRSNPATYSGAMDVIRTLYASTPEAKARAYKKGRFSFNVAGGRCEGCSGAGVRTIEMQFLPSVEVPCESCNGRRFDPETLEITWRGHSIDQVLGMTVDDALALFGAVPKLKRILGTMAAVGLGYVPLGQPSTTLSGGEAQRLKLASELHRPATGNTLYLLDEPTTGLHFEDVKKLLAAVSKLVDAGNTVLIVEHHADVIKSADHVIDLGPEGGSGGGQIVGQGTPEQIATLDTPTGRALATLPELVALPLAAEPVPKRARKRKLEARSLHIEGARQHNLQDVDVDIPHGLLTVITGVSGSGKTSLALDTVFAEGQRQYVESLSTYARRFLGRMERPPVERVEGLAPAIAIDQHSTSHNPRSTVATVTEIHDVLRLVYARVGVPHCPQCGRVVRAWSPSDAAALLARESSGAGWLTAPLRPVEEAVGERRRSLVRDGWTKVLDAKGHEHALEEESTEAALAAGCELVVDRLNPAKSPRARVSEAVATAYGLAHGVAWFRPRRGGDALRLTAAAECTEHGTVLPDALTPRHFSFNSRLGACTRCEGLGRTSQVVPERMLPNPEAGVWEAIDGRVSGVVGRSARKRALIIALLDLLELTEATPVGEWSQEQRDALLYGVDVPLTLRWSQSWGRTRRNVEEVRHWPGLVSIVEGWNGDTSWLSAERTCPVCKGGRLRPALLAVTVADLGIDAFARLSVDDALQVLDGWDLGGSAALIAERPREELRRRLAFLSDVGLGYLSLERTASTLSGGEAQRIRLASQLGVGLTGVIYVLDEPTIGLHPRDTDRLIRTLEDLRDQGNTVIVVEHDPETISRADHVIDMGPEAGVHGGKVVAFGTPAALREDPASPTGRWLCGLERMPVREARRSPRAQMVVRRPTGNNLVGSDISVPTGVLVGISGVSGSGKSTLVMDTLAVALRAHCGQAALPAPCDGVELGEAVDRVVVVDQRPIGRTPRSSPATYTKVMDALRALFAETPAARARGWKPGRFTYNGSDGRCPVCEGRGAVLVEMHFLPDVWVTCDACRGSRFEPATLEVRYKDRSIADFLSMRIDEALGLLKNHRRLARPLKALVDVGLGYLSLGQAGNTLSGGEAQRVKLAAELHSRKGHAVYVLDEPTTGLHLSDVRKLIAVLHRLVDQGHTVIAIEHHVDVLATADWLIDLGPEGGAAGGRVVGQGAPEQIAALDTPTGRALRGSLDMSAP